MMSAGVFEGGTGKGLFALAVEFFRNLGAIVVFAYVFAIVMDLGETGGVWWGVVVGNILGAFVGYGWARIYIARLIAVSRKRGGAVAA